MSEFVKASKLGASVKQAVKNDPNIPRSTEPVKCWGMEMALFPYQIETVEWMYDAETTENCKGGLCVFDMGLGKTATTIGLLSREREAKNKEKDKKVAATLIIAPKNVRIDTWPTELKKFNPSLRIAIYDVAGGRPGVDYSDEAVDIVLTSYERVRLDFFVAAARRTKKIESVVGQKRKMDDLEEKNTETDAEMQEGVDEDLMSKQNQEEEEKKEEKKEEEEDEDEDNVWLKRRKCLEPDPKKLERAARHSPLLFDRTWQRVVLDEASCIKNVTTKLHAACMHLCANARWCLSGTPLTNGLTDLAALFAFIRAPELDLSKPIRKIQDFFYCKENLASSMMVRYARRFTESQLLELTGSALPEREFNIFQVDFSGSEERNNYAALVGGLSEKLAEQGGENEKEENKYSIIFEIITKLRRTALAPCIGDPVQFGSWKELRDDWTCLRSAKMLALAQQVKRLGAEEKMILFTDFVDSAGLAAAVCDRQGYPAVLYHSKMSEQDKKTSLERFRTDPSCRVFCCTLKSGGMGLNLTVANRVLHLDQWWNPSVDHQAVKRAHRFGQKYKVVQVYVLLRNTIDEHVALCGLGKIAEFKRVVDDSFGVTRNYSWECVNFGTQGGGVAVGRGTVNAYKQIASQCVRKIQSSDNGNPTKFVIVDTEMARQQRFSVAQQLSQRPTIDLYSLCCGTDNPSDVTETGAVVTTALLEEHTGVTVQWVGDCNKLRAVHLLDASEMRTACCIPKGTLLLNWSQHLTGADMVGIGVPKTFTISNFFDNIDYGKKSHQLLQRLKNPETNIYQDMVFAVHARNCAVTAANDKMIKHLASQGLQNTFRSVRNPKDELRPTARAHLEAHARGELTEYEYRVVNDGLVLHLYVTTEQRTWEGASISSKEFVPVELLCYLFIPFWHIRDLLLLPPPLQPSNDNNNQCTEGDVKNTELKIDDITSENSGRNKIFDMLQSMVQSKGRCCLIQALFFSSSPSDEPEKIGDLWVQDRMADGSTLPSAMFVPRRGETRDERIASELHHWTNYWSNGGDNPTPFPWSRIYLYQENIKPLFDLLSQHAVSSHQELTIAATKITGIYAMNIAGKIDLT
jgi:hypothetical protein